MPSIKFLFKEINRLVGKCLHRYSMLDDGDRILVAVSGGSDSLLALYFLRQWQKKAPISFELLPVYLDMGFEVKDGIDGKAILKKYFSSMEGGRISYHIEETDYGVLAHSPFNKKKSPCFLCSMLRRKRLFELTHTMGCNKLCLGHNQDDIIETFFMNLIYSGELSTMVPKQKMFKGIITIIRPLSFVPKSKINALSKAIRLPMFENPCPSSKKTKREGLKSLLEGIYSLNPDARAIIMNALSNVRTEYLLS